VPKNTKPVFTEQSPGALELFHPAVRDWFESVFTAPTRPQSTGWPPIARNESTLILAPTGTGKTLAAFLWCINRIMFGAVPAKSVRCRVIYISPIKALAVDVERNLRAALVGIAQAAPRRGADFHQPTISIRTGDTPPKERAHFQRHPADILNYDAGIFVPAADLERARFSAWARAFLLSNVGESSGGQTLTYTGMRRTTGRSNVEELLWVYRRRGRPCRRCGTAIESRKRGSGARTTFWCPQCQPTELAKTFRNAAAG
jgi:hypothetical protein